MFLGRDHEERVIGDLLARVPGRGGALVVIGDPGIGKSTLAGIARRSAVARGLKVLAATGVPAESRLPYAGLHQLLRPLRDDIDHLPGPQRGAIHSAFGKDTDHVPDRFLVAMAVTDLLTTAAARQPLLILADDAHWLDTPTCDVLAFLGRRIDDEPVVLLGTARDGYPLPLLEAGLEELRLGALGEQAAGQLLDAIAPGLGTAARREILDTSLGNPLALSELSRSALGPDAAPVTAGGGTAVTHRIEKAFAARWSELPKDTRAIVLVAALNEGGTLSETLEAASRFTGSPLTTETVAPAITARLLDAGPGWLRFRHPLIRSAIEYQAGPDKCMAAHAALAAVLAGQSDRRAWHRAAAALGPDETVAAELDDAASRAERRAAVSVAITALERAVELSVDPAARNGRLLRAARLSVELGRPALAGGFVRDVDQTGLNLADRARLAQLQQYGARQSGPPGRQSRTLLPVERDWASPPAPPAGAAEDMSGARPDSSLIGRSGELSRLQALIGGDGGALVVLGEAGIGKSALLADLAGYAAARGLRVLSAAGRERESSLALAGLRQLLRPVLVELLTLPGRPGEELRAALSLTSMPPASDPLLTSTALLQLLAGPPGGVLVLVDNAQWMDGASLDMLALAARRAAGAVTMIFAARGDVPPPGLDQGLPELRPGPLSAAGAGALLAAQPHPPPGRARAQILAQAGGNPLALIELARAVAADPAGGRGWGGLPLPLTGRLKTVFAARLGMLPAETRHALLWAAVADGDVRGPGPDPEVLAPAEELGLITVDTSGVRFRHPLVRSAVYHDAPFASRAAAHRKLAEMLPGRPDRRAWHRAAASLVPDEDVAAALAAASSAAEQRGGAAAAALALERAADLSRQPADRARRLVAAADAAVRGGQGEWAAELAARALGLTRDRGLRSRARYVTGWALAWAGRYHSAAQVLVPLARETAPRDPAAAWDALGLAATAAYQAGDSELRQAVADTLTGFAPGGESEARPWVLAVCGLTAQAGVLPRPSRDTAAGGHAGAAAWLLDRTTDAIGLLRAARDDLQACAASSGPLAALGWACLDAGQWDDALELTAPARALPGADLTSSTATLITATIEAARGNTERARALTADALAADPEHSRLITARARHALGLCALAEGDYRVAFDHLRRLFDDDGTPYHYHASYLAAGDLALAAARSGHRLEGRKALKRISAGLASPSARVRQSLARADGILADPFTPGAYPGDALRDAAGEQWPFERAQLRLELGEWLRRRRRINQAKPVLSAAFEAFRALRARPWQHLAEAELRACGIAVTASPAGAAGLRQLTPQQRHIIRLAAEGLSNREIAQRLFLSPRTVASHLYRSFPKLGIAGRHQLHGLLAQADHSG